MSNLNTLKTISLKSIGITIPSGGGEYLSKTVALISGVISGFSYKSTQYGESIALSGDFVAVNAITGEVFEGSKAFLPDDFSKTIVQQLEKGQVGETLEIKNLEIVVAPSEKAGRGYTFIVRNLHTAELVNKKQELAAAMLGALKALPAPEAKKKPKAA